MKKFLVAMWQKCAKYLAEVGKSERIFIISQFPL